MIHEAFTPLGSVIAAAYIAVIGSILWWMLHIPKLGDVEEYAKRITREASAFRRIVVPVQGDALSDRIVALASQMAKFRNATLDVLYVIEVPNTLPITARMDDQEASANNSFSKAEKIAHKYDLKVNRRIERARQAGPAIVKYVDQVGADVLMIGDVPKGNRRGTQFARSVEYVFENAPCEVIIDRPQMS